MNKIFWLSLLSFLLCFSLSAASSPESIIILESISNRGRMIKKEVVLIKDSKVIVNREKLSPSEIITQSEYLKKISTFLISDTGAHCESGRFKHIFKMGKVIKEEHGCLNSDRFNFLEKSFKELKKDRMTTVKGQ